MNNARQIAQEEIDRTLAVAESLYGYNLTPHIEYANMGRCAGQAIRKGLCHHTIKLNEQLLTDEYRDELIDTIRHEIAHLVCYFMPTLGKGHNAGWKRVAAALGAKPERCHELPLKKARRTRKAIYEVNGEEMPIGLTVHKRIQWGQSYRVRGGGQIKPYNFTGKIVVE